jgi:hypothetical protein
MQKQEQHTERPHEPARLPCPASDSPGVHAAVVLATTDRVTEGVFSCLSKIFFESTVIFSFIFDN